MLIIHYRKEKENQKKIYYCKECGKKISKGAKLCNKCNARLRAANHLNNLNNGTRKSKSKRPDKEILLKDLLDNKGNFEAIGRKYQVTSNAVRKWCRKYELPDHSFDYRERNTKININHFKIKVAQIDQYTNEIINCFDSITEAVRNLGLNDKCISHISSVCKGKRKTAYGYKWRYL